MVEFFEEEVRARWLILFVSLVLLISARLISVGAPPQVCTTRCGNDYRRVLFTVMKSSTYLLPNVEVCINVTYEAGNYTFIGAYLAECGFTDRFGQMASRYWYDPTDQLFIYNNITNATIYMQPPIYGQNATYFFMGLMF